MHSLAINPATQRQVMKFLKAPSQVLAIMGPDGAGQEYIAEYIGAELLDAPIENLENHASIIRLSKPEGKTELPIESVRELTKKLAIKAISRRLVLIEEADTLSLEAQNALLKTLEQPPTNTFFILTLNSPLLPTVMSRAQIINVRPVSLTQALSHYKASDSKIKSAWSISEGAPQLLDDIINSEGSSKALDEAKRFITSTKYERALIIDDISKDRRGSLDFLEALSKVLKALHHAQIKKDSSRKMTEYIVSRRLIDKTVEIISANGLTKLALLNLVMNLRV